MRIVQDVKTRTVDGDTSVTKVREMPEDNEPHVLIGTPWPVYERSWGKLGLDECDPCGGCTISSC